MYKIILTIIFKYIPINMLANNNNNNPYTIFPILTLFQFFTHLNKIQCQYYSLYSINI